MRVIKEFTHGPVRISIFNWNNKYLIKLECGHLEQTFKVNELDLENKEQVENLVNAVFIENCLKRFEEMNVQLEEALKDPYQ